MVTDPPRNPACESADAAGPVSEAAVDSASPALLETRRGHEVEPAKLAEENAAQATRPDPRALQSGAPEVEQELPRPESPAATLLESRPAESTRRLIAGKPARRRWRPQRKRDLNRSVAIEERQSIALATLAVIGVLGAAYLARAILMPMVLAITLTLTFRPVVRLLKRRGIPLAVSSGVVVFSLVGIVLAGTIYLAEPAQMWVQGAPDDLKEVANRLHAVRDKLLQLQQASERLEELASGEPAEAPPQESGSPADLGSRLDQEEQSRLDRPQSGIPVEVEVRQPRLMTGLQALGSAGTVLGSLVLTFVLAYFLMSGGDSLINNVLHILPSRREKRSVVELVYKVERGISSYLSTVTCINAGLGICIGLAMWALGMPNPALWGVMAALLNFIPYLGALVGIIIVSLVAVLSFDSIGHAAIVPLTYLALTALEGNFITPTILGRSMSLNPVIVFLALTFWGWMWGIVGALLAVPILAMLKIGFDQFERTRPIGTLLGE